MRKGLPKEPGWYWVKHAGILGGRCWWEIKKVYRRRVGGLVFYQDTENYRGSISVGMLASVEWYGPIPKPE